MYPLSVLVSSARNFLYAKGCKDAPAPSSATTITVSFSLEAQPEMAAQRKGTPARTQVPYVVLHVRLPVPR